MIILVFCHRGVVVSHTICMSPCLDRVRGGSLISTLSRVSPIRSVDCRFFRSNSLAADLRQFPAAVRLNRSDAAPVRSAYSFGPFVRPVRSLDSRLRLLR